MKKLLIGFFAVLLTVPLLAGDNIFISKEFGISMKVPASKASTLTNQQIAIFFLPASDGFAANVNVLRQKYNGTMKAYDKLSQQQFKNLKWKVIRSNYIRKDKTIIYEYKGTTGGRDLHWYAKAVKSGNYVYLVTATCLDRNWEKQKNKLIESVDSFIIK